MKTIEEINEIAPYHSCEWQQGYGIWQAGYMAGQKDAAAEQKAELIDKVISYIERMPQDLTRQEIIDGLIDTMEE